MKQNASLKEFVQVKVYETLQTYLRDLEKYQYDNQEAIMQLTQVRSQLEREKIERETIAKQLKDIREDSRRRIDNLERRNQELESEAQLMNQNLKSNEQSRVKQQNQAETIRHLETVVKHLEEQGRDSEAKIQQYQDSKHEVERRCEQLRREVDMLTQDKAYLQRENTLNEDKARRLEDKLDRTEQALLETKKQAEKYMDRVLTTNDDLKLKFDQQYTNEIQDMKSRYTKDLEMMKQNLVDIYETKTLHLTERRDELELRNNKLDKQLADRNKSYEELLYEFRQLQKTTDEEIGHLRVQSRSAQDEITRVTNLYEDNLILVKETKMEAEALRSKIDVLKTEYYKLESTARQGNGDIKAELAVCKERLASYELIEKELDQAIMNIAGDATVEGDGTNHVGNALIQTITSAPTSSKRRIQQSLLLANRLQTKQKELEEIQKELTAKNK